LVRIQSGAPNKTPEKANKTRVFSLFHRGCGNDVENPAVAMKTALSGNRWQPLCRHGPAMIRGARVFFFEGFEAEFRACLLMGNAPKVDEGLPVNRGTNCGETSVF
jgi:hypothetical protein